MIKDAEAHADEAHKLRELADARNMAESLAYQTERTLKEHRDKLDESDASTIEGRIMELKGVLESQDRERDPAEDRGAPGGLAEARRGDLRAGDRPAAGGVRWQRRRDGSDDEVVEEADYEVIDEEEAKTS